MANIPQRLRHWILADDNGVTSIEYGLLGVLIAVAIVATVMALGGNVSTLFGNVAKCFPLGKC